MERLTRKLPDGRKILTGNFAYVRNPKYGSFVEGYAVDKLADYEIAEEQGLLLRLPCRVGSTVWILQKKCRYAGVNNNPWESCNQYWDNVQINGMWGCAGKDDEGNPLVCEKKEMEWFARQMEYTLGLFSPDIVLGENMFLTQEEAEQALKRMESE